MFELDPTWIQVLIGLAGLALTCGFFVFMIRKQNALFARFTPIIQKVFSGLGKKSSQDKEIKQFEAGMMEDLFSKGLPELGLLQELGIISEERMAWIKENPEGLMVLIERWGPLAMRLIKMRGGSTSGFNQQTQSYDF